MAPLKSTISIVVFLISASLTLSESNIRMFPTRNSIAPHTSNEQYCESWKFSFEAGNAGNGFVSSECLEFVMKYLYGKRYLEDSYVVANYSYEFAKTVNISFISAYGKDAWIFDIDETLLSNVPVYKEHGYGSENFKEWMEKGEASALPASLKLYKKLLNLGFNIILLTGREESLRNSTVQNLLSVGYYGWGKLIMRGPFDRDKTAMDYKSNKRDQLVYDGYILHGNSGDQWSDLRGHALATRSFKLPNPLYNIP